MYVYGCVVVVVYLSLSLLLFLLLSPFLSLLVSFSLVPNCKNHADLLHRLRWC